MRGRSGPLAVLAALLGVACFGEAPVVGGQTTGEPCPEGAQGCSCYPNGTCDGGLECEPTLALCIPTGCAPGERDCVCMNGSCAPPWVCEAGICGDGSTSTSATTLETSGSSGAESGSTSGKTTETSVSSTVADDTTTEDPSETEDTGENPCTTMSCSDCLVCAAQPGHPCADEYTACQSTSGCMLVATCQANCAFYFDCTEECCNTSQPAAQAAQARA
mgnify:FL=1